MTATRLLTTLLCASLALLPAHADADPEPDWLALNHQAARQVKAGDFAGLHDTLAQLAPAMPGNPTIVYRQAHDAAQLGHPEEAVAALGRLADAGLTYDVATSPDFAPLAGRPDFVAVTARLAANRDAVGTPAPLMRLARDDALPEALAWDARTKRLFIGDVRRCETRVIRRPGSRTAAPTLFARLPASVFALSLDAKRHRLWATIATVAQGDGCGEGPLSAERTALLALDARSGRVLRRIEPGLPGVLGDMLVTRDGTVFVTESLHGAVLRLRPHATKLERLDIAGDFDSPQTPALSADGRTLVVPDYLRGIGTLPLGGGPSHATWPAHGAGVFTSGIDGLVRDGATLVAVQNGTTPPRVIRFSDDLQRQQVLESGTPGLGEPTHAIVVGRTLWFISDVGWDRLDARGQRASDAAPSVSELRTIPLGQGLPATESR